jgi:hypothetical protein
MRAVYIHTAIYNNRDYTSADWRVFEGLLLRGGDTLSLPAEVLFIDDQGAIRIEREKHLSARCGATTWVYASEFEHLAEMVESDWKRRGLWREAYYDIQRLRKDRETEVSSRACAEG